MASTTTSTPLRSAELPGSSTDPLGETLHLLRLTGTLYCRSELTAPWGVDLPPLDGCMMFHIVSEGECLLEVGDPSGPLLLRKGSVALVPHGQGHVICSHEGATTEGLFDIPVEKVSDRYEVMRYGGGGALTHLTCGVVRFDHVAAQHLVTMLPRVIHVDSWDDDGSWLQSTVRFISSEAKALRPGGETVITRLADIVVIQVLRAWIDSSPEADQGWLGALRDDQIGCALIAMHADPARDWSVESLAREVGMSRSAFSARFTDLVGESAMRYLTRWRLQLARTNLLEGNETLAVIAERVGYQSEAAFCRAFKREFGGSPGRMRKK